MYEFVCLREVFEQIHGINKKDQESEIKTTADLDDLYSKIKLPERK